MPPIGVVLDQANDLAGLRVPSERDLAEDGPAVDDDLEPAARRLEQLDGGVRILGPELGRQTGGPRIVASDDAVFDRDVHAASRDGEA